MFLGYRTSSLIIILTYFENLRFQQLQEKLNRRFIGLSLICIVLVMVHCYVYHLKYRISSAIRRGFFSFQNNPKDLDPSYKTDLDL